MTKPGGQATMVRMPIGPAMRALMQNEGVPLAPRHEGAAPEARDALLALAPSGALLHPLTVFGSLADLTGARRRSDEAAGTVPVRALNPDDPIDPARSFSPG